MKLPVVIVAIALAVGCHGDKPKMTMTPAEVIDAIRDYADRGCACGTDKECFHAIRDEWEQQRRSILHDVDLMTGDDRAQYDAERQRFGLCGDAAGLAVFDGV
jgi:hypothetical protein